MSVDEMSVDEMSIDELSRNPSNDLPEIHQHRVTVVKAVINNIRLYIKIS